MAQNAILPRPALLNVPSCSNCSIGVRRFYHDPDQATVREGWDGILGLFVSETPFAPTQPSSAGQQSWREHHLVHFSAKSLVSYKQHDRTAGFEINRTHVNKTEQDGDSDLCVGGVKGDPFLIDIDANLSVLRLKEAIKWDDECTTKRGAKDLDLYRTKRGRTWLTPEDTVLKRLRRGEMAEDIRALVSEDSKLNPLLRMGDERRLGKSFAQKGGEVHVLVEMPEPALDPRMLCHPSFNLQVCDLVAMIKRVQGAENARLIVLENSSDTRKTQIVFNLMAHEKLDVVHLVCLPMTELYQVQKVHRAFSIRSVSFLRCVEFDLPFVGTGEVFETSSNKSLCTCGFVWAMLTGATSFCGEKSSKDVQSALKSRERERGCVIFLDDFPGLNDDGDHSRVSYLRFMLNAFRVFGLIVIASAKNGSVRNLVAAGSSHSRRNNGHSSLRYVVFPSLPRFDDDSVWKKQRDRRCL
ncbi:hypothetical protein FI667_g6431, partial [Globisporangium splendens]